MENSSSVTFELTNTNETITLTTSQWVQPIYCLGGISKPDKNWEHTDLAGHIHKWGENNLPTLNRLEETEYHECYPECCDGWEETIVTYKCKVCDEVIKPGYVRDNSPLYRYGNLDYYIDGIPVFKKDYYAKLAELTHMINKYKRM